VFRLKATVSANCWFCNQNLSVPYRSRNSWDCGFCGQYNGFKSVCFSAYYRCNFLQYLVCYFSYFHV